jgi:hypothetical protein
VAAAWSSLTLDDVLFLSEPSMHMRHRARLAACGLFLALPSLSLSAQAVTPAPQAKHHSKVKGALVGAAAGHVMGGHAKAGAVAGAMVQHHRNKKAAATTKP